MEKETWRPENWVNPHREMARKFREETLPVFEKYSEEEYESVESYGRTVKEMRQLADSWDRQVRVYEAGADAMLRALTK